MAPSSKNVRARNAKFVLFIGDEGAILVYMQGKKVLRRLFAATPEASNTRTLLDALANDPIAPISLIIDVIDQSFIKQTLPPVTQFSVGKLIKRRLDKDFAADDIKGSIILGRDKSGRKDWNYMMVSLASSPILTKWIDLIAERPNPFDGIYLVPIEAEIYTKKLVESQGLQSRSEWQLLISHNKVSGFRQVILQNGKIVFTRMAQPIGDSLPEVIAGNIEQEIINTSEYLKRLGYMDQAGLDIYIVVSEDIKNSIDSSRIKCTHVSIFTPYQVASGMGLEQAAQPEDHFGDVVFAAHFGSTKKHKLSLQTKYTQRLIKLNLIAKAMRLFAALIALGILFAIGQISVETYETYQSTLDLEKQKVSYEKILQDTNAIAAKIPGDNEKIADIVSIYELFNKRTLSPYWFINKVRNTLNDKVRVRSFSWNLMDPLNVKEKEDKRLFNATLKVDFLINDDDAKLLGKTAVRYVDAITKEFEGYKITHSELPGLLEDNETLTLSDLPGSQNQTAPGLTNNINSIDISISSEAKNP